MKLPFRDLNDYERGQKLSSQVLFFVKQYAPCRPMQRSSQNNWGPISMSMSAETLTLGSSSGMLDGMLNSDMGRNSGGNYCVIRGIIMQLIFSEYELCFELIRALVELCVTMNPPPTPAIDKFAALIGRFTIFASCDTV